MAATDTTSGALTQILQLLAENPEAQEKLREEILQATSGEGIPYDELVELPYLDAICRETLRLYVTKHGIPFLRLNRPPRYPPISEVYRECVVKISRVLSVRAAATYTFPQRQEGHDSSAFQTHS